MRILITGGAGFIGSHLAESLVAAGDGVVILDDLSRGDRANLPSAADFEQADVADDSLDDILARHRPDVVVHCAARASVSHSMSKPLDDYRANQLGAFKVARAASRTGVQHLILLSTAGVYGRADHPSRETDVPTPANYYGIHKWAAERYFELSGVPWTALRLANVYGPRQRFDGEGGSVAIFLDRLRTGEEIILYGAGEQTRDYVYVTDVVDAIVAAIRERLFGIWNVGSGRETTLRAILDALASATGLTPRVRVEPLRAGDVARSCLDASRLVATGAWRPRVALEEGIARLVLGATRTTGQDR